MLEVVGAHQSVSGAMSLHPADLHWSQVDSAGVRLPAAAVLSGLVQCE